MKALCWLGKDRVAVEDVPDPRILSPRDAILKITRTAICGSDLHLLDGFIPTMERGDILGHEFMGEVVETGPECDGPQGRRSGRRPVHDQLRQLLLLQEAALVALRQQQPRRAARRDRQRLQRLGALRLLAHVRRLCGRPGAVRARAVRRRGPAQGPRAPARREGPVPLRHPADGLHGRGQLQHPARRRGRRLRLRTGRPAGDHQRLRAGRRARRRHRSHSRAPAPGAVQGQGRHPQLRASQRPRGAQGDDRRARARFVHRRRRPRGPRRRPSTPGTTWPRPRL